MAGSVSYHAIRCGRCGLYQVQQVKKSGRFQCTKCRAQQKVDEEFYRGAAKECREIVQELSKAAHLGKIDFTPAASDAYKESSGSTRRRVANEGSSNSKEKLAQITRADEEATQVQHDEDALFLFESPKRKGSPEDPKSERRNMRCNAPKTSAASGEGVSTSNTSSWRRRSFDRLAKFRFTDETDGNTATRDENEVQGDASSAQDAAKCTPASPRRYTVEKGPNIELSNNNDTSGLFDFGETVQKVTPQSINEKGTFTPQNSKKSAASIDPASDDSDDELFSSVETPLKNRELSRGAGSSVPTTPANEQKPTKAAFDDGTDLLVSLKTPPKSTNTDKIPLEQEGTQSCSRLSSQCDDDLFNFINTPSKNEHKTGTLQTNCVTPKASAAGPQAVELTDGDDDIFDGVNTPEKICVTKDSPVPTGVPVQLKSDTSGNEPDRLPTSAEGSSQDDFQRGSTPSNTNVTWRRRSLAKLHTFRYDDTEEGDKARVGMEKAGRDCEMPPTLIGDAAVRGEVDRPSTCKITNQSASVPVVSNDERNSPQEEAEEKQSSPRTVGREKLLKTLEKFKVTPSPKRRKVLG